MALIGTNGQGVGTSVFQQWSNNCKKNLSSDQLELFEQFVDNAYDAMEQGTSYFDVCLNTPYATTIVICVFFVLNSCWSRLFGQRRFCSFPRT